MTEFSLHRLTMEFLGCLDDLSQFPFQVHAFRGYLGTVAIHKTGFALLRNISNNEHVAFDASELQILPFQSNFRLTRNGRIAEKLHSCSTQIMNLNGLILMMKLNHPRHGVFHSLGCEFWKVMLKFREHLLSIVLSCKAFPQLYFLSIKINMLSANGTSDKSKNIAGPRSTERAIDELAADIFIVLTYVWIASID